MYLILVRMLSVKSHVLLIPRDPYNTGKMTKNIKEVKVETIEN